MALRKRTWRAPNGEQKQAWVVDYRDTAGKRRWKQFARKKDAERWYTQAAWEVSRGTHTADSQSITVSDAAKLWLARAGRENLEPTTVAAYEQHVRLHINPLCGTRKLSQLNKPIVEGFRDILVETLSRPMAMRVMRSLTSIVSEAERRGFVAQNVCAGVTVRRSKRDKSAIEIPAKLEMRALIKAAMASNQPMDAPLILVSLFCGLRASETRGLTWRQIDLKRETLTVDRRADAANVIEAPKSNAGNRTIPLATMVASALRKWKLRCPQTELDLVFPSQAGAVISHRSLHNLHFWPLQIAAEVCDAAVDERGRRKCGDDGLPIMKPRYSSHALRHCAASLWIEQCVSPKRIQRWMGHSSIQVTFDTYGHLFEQAEADASVMHAVELEIMGGSDVA